METEQRTPLMAKKLWGIIRAILCMTKKGLSKNIPWFEIHMMLKRSTKLAGNLLLDHHTLSAALMCRSNDIHSNFMAPREYEFSCSNTSLYYPKRKNNRQCYYIGNHHNGRNKAPTKNLGGFSRQSNKDNDLTIKNVKQVFDILNNYETTSFVEPEKSPLTLLGFGESPNVRHLRVTDSPFPMNNTEEDTLQVDKAAEEFIMNFYKELKQEKKRAAVEPPSSSPQHYYNWGLVR